MSTMKHKLFGNRVQLWKHLSEVCDGIDFNRTIKLPICSFSKDGKDYISRDSKQFLIKLNQMFGTHFDVCRSRRRGQVFTLIWWEDESGESVVEEASQDTVVEDVEATQEAIDVEALLAKAQALYNEDDEKGSRQKLKDFAAEYDVELSVRKLFDNMLVDFKAALEA